MVKVVEFTPKHALGDIVVTIGGRRIVHQDGRPVMGGELTPGRVHVVAFDENKPNAPAVLREQKVKTVDIERRDALRAKRAQKLARRKNR